MLALRRDDSLLHAARLGCAASIALAWYNEAAVQSVVDCVWSVLRQNLFYRSVVFETVFTILLTSSFYTILWYIEQIPYVHRHCMPRRTKKPMAMPSNISMIKQAVKHALIFGPLDFITPKRYGHVDPVLYERRPGYFHIERILPVQAPSVGDILWETGVAMVLYDAMFFVFHILLHKVPFLWKTVHKHHHDQEELSAFETDHLHPFEQLMLVLLGNESLRIVGAHPLSRTVFNVWLLYVLTINHSAMEFSLSVDRIVPFSLLHSPSDHEVHHVKNMTRNYQPVFAYLDALMDRFAEQRKNSRKAQLTSNINVSRMSTASEETLSSRASWTNLWCIWNSKQQ